MTAPQVPIDVPFLSHFNLCTLLQSVESLRFTHNKEFLFLKLRAELKCWNGLKLLKIRWKLLKSSCRERLRPKKLPLFPFVSGYSTHRIFPGWSVAALRWERCRCRRRICFRRFRRNLSNSWTQRRRRSCDNWWTFIARRTSLGLHWRLVTWSGESHNRCSSSTSATRCFGNMLSYNQPIFDE